MHLHLETPRKNFAVFIIEHIKEVSNEQKQIIHHDYSHFPVGVAAAAAAVLGTMTGFT